MQPELPVLAYEAEIARTVAAQQVTVIKAETGAGKSTQIGFMLLRAGIGAGGMIGVTEPRRIAAMSLAEWVAGLHGTPLGRVVGYQIKGERKLEASAQMVYMTEGILLRQLHSDPYLRRYSVVVLDEVHERGINQDLLLALLKPVLRRRPDLKVIVMSATIAAGNFSTHFEGAPVVEVPGRVFPVEVSYLPATPSGPKELLDAFVDQVRNIVARENGDLLAFFPDEHSIKAACRALESAGLGDVRILPLYGTQAREEQREVFRRDGCRRVILATNIAETSLTIDGVCQVVDTGLIKQTVYVSAAMSALRVVEHSQAGCEQRRGRAGRTAPGKCYRLFSRADWADRAAYTEPEIRRTALDQVLLYLRVHGYSLEETVSLEFMDSPGRERWIEAAARLMLLGALDAQGEVTEDGRRMERMPLAPMLGRVILSAVKYGCVDQIVTAVAGMVARPVFVRPKDHEDEADVAHELFKVPESDALTILKVWEEWCEAGENGERNKWAREHFLSSRALREIERNREHLFGVLTDLGIELTSNPDPTLTRKAVAAGLIVNLCTLAGQHAYHWHGRDDVYIFPGSALFKKREPRYLVCAEIVESSRAFARGVTAIEESWLEELIPEQACERALRVERSYGGVLGDSWQWTWKMVETLLWLGTQIRQREITRLAPSHIPLLALELVRDMVEGIPESWHPQSLHNRAVWQQLREIKRIEGVPYGVKVAEAMARVELLQRIHAWFASRLQGARTLAEVGERDVRICLDDWLTPEELTAYQARQGEARAEAEDWQRVREQRELQLHEAETRARQERIEAARSALEPLRALEARLERLTDLERGEGRQLVQRVRRVREECELGWSRPEEVEEELPSIERVIRNLEQAQADRLELSEQVWQGVLAEYPACPLCSGAWEELDQDKIGCRKWHEGERLIPLREGVPEGRIARFLTDRDEVAAEVNREGGVSGKVVVSFKRPRTHAWDGKKFKTLRCENDQGVLPAELVGQRVQILQDLQVLREARRELEAIIAQLKEAAARVGAGAMVTMTFTVTGALAAAETPDFYYHVPPDAPSKPKNGERWFCRIGHDLGHSGGKRMVEVYPEFRVQSVASVADLEGLREVLKEAYPGLPDQLLYVQ